MPSSARRCKPPRPPGQRVARRNARKEKLVKCVLAPRPKTHHPPRGGSHRNRRRPKRARRPAQIGACTDTPTPVARRATAPERVKAIFSLPPGAAHSLFVKNKKRMGGAPLWEQPLAGASTPGGRRPAAHITSAPPVAAAQQIVRGDVEVVRQLDEVRDLRIICG